MDCGHDRFGMTLPGTSGARKILLSLAGFMLERHPPLHGAFLLALWLHCDVKFEGKSQRPCLVQYRTSTLVVVDMVLLVDVQPYTISTIPAHRLLVMFAIVAYTTDAHYSTWLLSCGCYRPAQSCLLLPVATVLYITDASVNSTVHGYLPVGAAGQHRIWDEAHPVHLVGHSAGVQVARLLQQMLADKVSSEQGHSAAQGYSSELESSAAQGHSAAETHSSAQGQSAAKAHSSEQGRRSAQGHSAA